MTGMDYWFVANCGGEKGWKQGRSARLKSHCAVRLQDRHAYIQAHLER